MESIVLNSRELCDLEMLLNGGFAPLEGFLNKEDYFSVLNDMRLSNGKSGQFQLHYLLIKIKLIK
jgi:sulfate adenylyltransferase